MISFLKLISMLSSSLPVIFNSIISVFNVTHKHEWQSIRIPSKIIQNIVLSKGLTKLSFFCYSQIYILSDDWYVGLYRQLISQTPTDKSEAYE